MKRDVKIAVLVSGGGTNLAALIKAQQNGVLHSGKIALVVSNKADAYAFGDSANDLSMLSYLDNSVAMGNASPEELFSLVSYVTSKASEDGIANALSHLGFI